VTGRMESLFLECGRQRPFNDLMMFNLPHLKILNVLQSIYLSSFWSFHGRLAMMLSRFLPLTSIGNLLVD
jgi:hypothetical protein